MYSMSCDQSTWFSLGHLVIDALASRLGIHMSSGRGGFTGKGKVFIAPDQLVELTLYKSSMSVLINSQGLLR